MNLRCPICGVYYRRAGCLPRVCPQCQPLLDTIGTGSCPWALDSYDYLVRQHPAYLAARAVPS